MQRIKNIVIHGTANLPMATDIFFNENLQLRPVIIYVHGFNGFKDWGNFDLIADQLVNEGFVLVKFNFSHNGTTPEHPEEFVDLQAFGNNNYSIELEDLRLVIDWVCDPKNPQSHAIDPNNIILIGHSMGGGIAILQSARDKRVKKLITWASIAECKTPWATWSDEKMINWKLTGVQYYTNSRTSQQMPLFYQLYQDYLLNQSKLDIKTAIESLEIPILICHGTMDNAVPVNKAFELKSWQPTAQLFTLKSDHVFGRTHPWKKNILPPAVQAVLGACFTFLK